MASDDELWRRLAEGAPETVGAAALLSEAFRRADSDELATAISSGDVPQLIRALGLTPSDAERLVALLARGGNLLRDGEDS